MSTLGCQEPDSKDFEAFLVPEDYAADVPKDWWANVVAPVPVGLTKTVPKPPQGAAYRLISMLEPLASAGEEEL